MNLQCRWASVRVTTRLTIGGCHTWTRTPAFASENRAACGPARGSASGSRTPGQGHSTQEPPGQPPCALPLSSRHSGAWPAGSGPLCCLAGAGTGHSSPTAPSLGCLSWLSVSRRQAPGAVLLGAPAGRLSPSYCSTAVPSGAGLLPSSALPLITACNCQDLGCCLICQTPNFGGRCPPAPHRTSG